MLWMINCHYFLTLNRQTFREKVYNQNCYADSISKHLRSQSKKNLEKLADFSKRDGKHLSERNKKILKNFARY